MDETIDRPSLTHEKSCYFVDHHRCHAWVHWRLQHRLDMVIENNDY